MTEFIRSTPPGFHHRPTVLSHGWCALPPFRCDDSGTLGRIQKLRSGDIIDFNVREGEIGLIISTEAAITQGQQVEINAVIARCLSFEQDLSTFYKLVDAHPGYQWITRIGAGRMLRSPTVWEDLAKTLLTTNTTWAMTTSMVSRLNTLGEAAADASHAFPTPEQIASYDPVSLNEHIRAGYRGAYLHELATAITREQPNVESWNSPSLSSDEVYRALKGLKGFGDYAAGAMMRLLGRFDQLGLDSVCRAAYARLHNGGVPASDREIAAYYAPFGEWQGLVVWMDVMRDELLANEI